MKKELKIIFILAICLICLGVYFYLYPSLKSALRREKPLVEEEPGCSGVEMIDCLTSDGEPGFRVCENSHFSKTCYLVNLDECRLKEEKLYNICCLEKEKLVYCDDKEYFKQGDYIIIKVNLQKAIEEAGVDFDPYKVCGFDVLRSENETYVPKKYEIHSEFSGNIGCSRLFRLKNFHHTSTHGLIPFLSGKVKLLEIRVYPAEVDVSSPEKAKENIDKSKIIFTYETNIIE